MPLVTRCTQCLKPSQVPDGFAGRQVRCPHCQSVFVVQAAAAPAVAAVAGTGAGKPSAGPAAPPRPGVERPRPAAPPPPSRPTAPPAPEASTPSHSQVQITGVNKDAAAGFRCPSCRAVLPTGASACLDCGWVKPDLDGSETDEQPLICTNPACGVANPRSERYCQRCNTMLPTAAGTTLQGRYEISKLLAIGGFGAVYLARDVKANRPVAIKDMICADAQEFNVRLNFFRREAEILRSLESVPIVPRLYDFIQQGQSAYLVMEYIPGRDLLKIMETNGNKPFPFDLVVEWGKQFCDVLQQMHSQQPPVVHRDLKPDNVMLLDDGKTIKMIDFGTARDVGRGHKTRLAAKTRVYTEGFAPPEQIIGKPEARSDLFALAGTLYNLATGKPPEGFYTGRELETLLQKGNGAIPPDQRWFYELLRINLSEDVNDRYFSAQEFKKDLEQRRVTVEVVCPACRHVNKVREPYCARCAEPLTGTTPPCQHCGKTNRLGSRCCIHCGNRLR